MSELSTQKVDSKKDWKLTPRAFDHGSHPFYWANFIQSGEWVNLDGRS